MWAKKTWTVTVVGVTIKKRPKLLWRLCLYIFLKLERNGTCFKSCVNGLV